METITAKGLNTALIAELKQEAAKTKKMIERVPVDKADWKPHDKSMTLGRLTLHVIDMTDWITYTIMSDELNLAGNFPNDPMPSDGAGLVKRLDKLEAKAIEALENASDEELNKPWTLRHGDHIIFTLPKKVVLRDMCFNHIIHHRGQLSVYLRLLNIPIPGMYGPSADEQ